MTTRHSPETRREFLKKSATALTALGSWPVLGQRLMAAEKAPLYKISLAQWSLHRLLKANKLDNLDFARTTKEEFGIDAVEYVNQFFFDKAQNQSYLKQMKQRAKDAGVKSLLIMVDGEGALGAPEEDHRKQSIENHKKWVEAAAVLGCHSIRVNAASRGSYEDQIAYAADGLSRLTQFAEQHNLSILVENHGGLSSNGAWLSAVIERVDHPHCGTLPDFGNFALDHKKGIWYDRYKGVAELMRYAQAVSAKSYEFDDKHPLMTYDRRGHQEHDFLKMMKIVIDAGYHGYVGIEYEGHELDEMAGVKKTKQILERCRDLLTKS